MADDKPIIIIKKKGGHGGHHGGAWKVAYADFVTAMMAFFMVMWLLNSAETKTRSAIASYFRRPGLFESGSGTPLLIGGAGILPDAYAPPKPYDETSITSGADTSAADGKGKVGKEKGPFVSQKTDQDLKVDGMIISEEALQGILVDKQREGGVAEIVEQIKAQKKKLEELAGELDSAMRESPELKELLGLVEVSVDADGLTIEIMDTENSSMFRSGSAQVLPQSANAFRKIADLLKSLPNKIEVIGHTDAKPFARKGGLSNWELSADRANAARRLLEQQGIPPERVTSVIGRADRELRFADEPFNASNRRISLKVKFDIAELSKQVEKHTEAFKEFSKYMAPPEQEVDETSPASIDGAANVQDSSAATKGKDSGEKKKTPAGLQPKIEIHGKKADRGIELPPERSKNGEQSSPRKVFKDSPVLGPNNPVFGF